MKSILLFAILIFSANLLAQKEKSSTVALPFELKVYTGGPNLAKAAYRLSRNFQDKITYSGKALIGIQGTHKFNRWVSAGFDITYRYGQLDFDINDSTFYKEIQEKWNVDLSGFPDPFGHYTLKVPRLRSTLRANIHFLPDNSKSDFYFGAAAGLNRVRSKLYLDEETVPFYNRIGLISLPVAYRLCLGYTYHFLPNLGVNTEIGLGGPFFSVGLSARF